MEKFVRFRAYDIILLEIEEYFLYPIPGQSICVFFF